MKYASLIAENIVALEAKLDATLHFGDSMETEPKKKHTLRNAAIAAGALGLGTTGALYGKGVLAKGTLAPKPLAAMSAAIRRGAAGVKRDIGVTQIKTAMRKGSNVTRAGGSVEDAYAAGIKMQLRRRQMRNDKVQIGSKPKDMEAALSAINELSAQVDAIINFDDNGASQMITNKQKDPNRGAMLKNTLIAGGGIAAGAGTHALYSRGKAANEVMPGAPGPKASMRANMRTGATMAATDTMNAGKKLSSGIKGKTKEVWGGTKTRATKLVKGAHAGIEGTLSKVGKMFKK
jgi:hypothetical protein